MTLDLEDLKTVVDFIDLLLINQHQSYFLNLKKKKVRLSHRFRLSIFICLLTRVTFYALKQIYQQYFLITSTFTALPACINVFIIVIELSCSHRIQQRMYDHETDEFIQLKDIHTH